MSRYNTDPFCKNKGGKHSIFFTEKTHTNIVVLQQISLKRQSHQILTLWFYFFINRPPMQSSHILIFFSNLIADLRKCWNSKVVIKNSMWSDTAQYINCSDTAICSWPCMVMPKSFESWPSVERDSFLIIVRIKKLFYPKS
jgi:hypothetical protein